MTTLPTAHLVHDNPENYARYQGSHRSKCNDYVKYALHTEYFLTVNVKQFNRCQHCYNTLDPLEMLARIEL